jgi:hypothetical protein
MRVIVHIEELVLHGFAAADRYVIADEVQRELQSRLATASPGALLRGGGVLEHLAAPTARLHRAAGANGRAIAEALHGVLAGDRGSARDRGPAGDRGPVGDRGSVEDHRPAGDRR